MPFYEPNFYTPENIIGYTGVLQKNPTVYFLSKTHYGHITQVHDEWTNVGREVIYPHATYDFGNQQNRLKELDSARPMQHTSRSPMILVRDGTLVPELTHALMVHAERKARHLTSAGVEVNPSQENVAHGLYPGQQPSDEEREAPSGEPILSFWWSRAGANGVPPESRLYKITQGI